MTITENAQQTINNKQTSKNNPITQKATKSVNMFSSKLLIFLDQDMLRRPYAFKLL